ncbi:hypothetical protein IAQ61_009141, partial [Plenodomus lingam]|uniref:uncharacterized protein n=1 Tax=Leptosphaeria maculans TaxID=5022 RepID=UPI003321AE8D
MDILTEEILIERFDQLVSEGVIIYGPHDTIPIEARGYPLTLRICPALATKPHTIGASNPAFHHARKWGPGSDLFCPDERLILTTLNGTHDLALNLFCVKRPQLLLPTTNSWKRQHEALDMDDMAVILETMRLFPSIYMLYNCGEDGGCSRVHKHLQGLPGPPHAFNHIVNSLTQNPRNSSFSPGIPFAILSHDFSSSSPSPHLLYTAYTALLARASALLNRPWDPVVAPPHNVVVWRGWLFVVPRRRGSLRGASANAGGMMGEVWVHGREAVEIWGEDGWGVLGGLGVGVGEGGERGEGEEKADEG